MTDKNMVQEILRVDCPNFSLKDTLDCGQCFRWEQLEDGSFRGIVGKRIQRVAQEGDSLLFYGLSLSEYEEFWRDYFDFSTDYDGMKAKLSFNKTIRDSIDYAGGIHLLQQDSWETLCSFIISQNNNIPRIKGIISRLCECFGEPLNDEGDYTFPTAQRLADLNVEELAPLRAGFRSKYILDAARKTADGTVNFDRIRQGTLAEGEEELVKIFGVGVKVAQCAMLYGFHKLDAFPVDTWIKKVLEEYYPKGFPKRANRYAGVAQQYLFHYIRTKDRAEA